MVRVLNLRVGQVAMAMFLVTVAASCGSSGGDFAGDGGAPASGVSSLDGGSGLGIGLGGPNIADSSDLGVGADAACASETIKSDLKPLALYLVLDRSQSMSTDNKWDNARSAFQQFVDDPKAAGIKIALTYFPNERARCDGTGYDAPAVPMGVLPTNAASIKNSLQTTPQTSLGTPIEGALHGIQRYCAQYAQANPAEKIAGVLITDGEPNGCNGNPDALAAIARNAFTGNPSVPVFAIGMEGASFPVLDAIAAAGGTQQSYNVSQGGAQSFVDALKSIAGKSIPCEVAVPTGPNADPAKVNVKYTDGAGKERYLGQVSGASACVSNAWYYANPQQPTTIMLCPEACSAVRGDAGGKIDVVLGCATIAPPPIR